MEGVVRSYYGASLIEISWLPGSLQPLSSCLYASGHNGQSCVLGSYVSEWFLPHTTEFPLVPYKTLLCVSNHENGNYQRGLSSRQVPTLYGSDTMGLRYHEGKGTRCQSRRRDYRLM